MRKFSFEEHEETPMLQGEGHSSRLNKIETIDSNDETQKTVLHAIRSRFTRVYFILGVLILVVIAILVVVLVLLFTMTQMDEKYSKMANFSNREDYMRLYEEIMRFRTSPHLTTNSIIDKLTPEQLQLAKLAGILPLENTYSAPFVTAPPIIPVLNEKAKNDTNEEPPFLRGQTWHNSSCNIQCTKQDITIPPLLIISLDGFARNYLDRGLVPSLDAMADCGARAEYMYPSFPSKTFPNHYTIATGLYPESHGIVDNYVYDPDISPTMENMKTTNYTGFYGGEPIWSLAVRQHRRMFCLFWPGCSFNITGYNPTIDIKYNKSLSYSSRVDMIIDWLMLDSAHRPLLIMAYFDQPDSVGHFHTTDKQVNLELIYLESVLNYLFTSLYKNGILDCTNIVILSDHGMQFLNKRLYADELINTAGMIVASGAVGRIHLGNSTKTAEWVENKLKCYDNESFYVYDKMHVPKRYHYAKTKRVGDVFLDGKPGTIFFSSKEEDYHVTSDHGYDYLVESMHAIFFARGPNIRAKTVLQPFQNIELFNFFSELLRLNNNVPNNGTVGMMDAALKNINLLRDGAMLGSRPVPECLPSVLYQKRELRACSGDDKCQQEAKEDNDWLDGCASRFQSPTGIFYVNDLSDTCFINLCDSVILSNQLSTYGRSTIVYESLTSAEFQNGIHTGIIGGSNRDCFIFDGRFDANCNNWTDTYKKKRANSLIWQDFLAAPKNELESLNRLQFLLYKDFYAGPFAHLQSLTAAYAKKYKRMAAITGTIYDLNNDGIADDAATFWDHQVPGAHLELLPTHLFRILFRCEDDLWHVNGVSCRNANATRLLAFVLPNQKNEFNCLMPHEYLMVNTARIKDIELLTNVQFFSERIWYTEKDVMFWKTNITTSLWDLL